MQKEPNAVEWNLWFTPEVSYRIKEYLRTSGNTASAWFSDLAEIEINNVKETEEMENKREDQRNLMSEYSYAVVLGKDSTREDYPYEVGQIIAVDRINAEANTGTDSRYLGGTVIHCDSYMDALEWSKKVLANSNG